MIIVVDGSKTMDSSTSKKSRDITVGTLIKQNQATFLASMICDDGTISGDIVSISKDDDLLYLVIAIIAEPHPTLKIGSSFFYVLSEHRHGWVHSLSWSAI